MSNLVFKRFKIASPGKTYGINNTHSVRGVLTIFIKQLYNILGYPATDTSVPSVLGCTIFSIYPDACRAIRQLFHGCIYPREVHGENHTLYIMWTRDGNFDSRPGALFQPNHFVPLLNLIYDIDSFNDFPLLTSSSPTITLKTAVKKRGRGKNGNDQDKGSSAIG